MLLINRLAYSLSADFVMLGEVWMNCGQLYLNGLDERKEIDPLNK